MLKWIVLALSVLATSYITDYFKLGFHASAKTLSEVIVLLVGVAALALLNATLGKILKLITLPISCATLGLFSVVINAVVFWFAASLELGFRITKPGIEGFIAAMVASICVSLINGILQNFLPDKKDE